MVDVTGFQRHFKFNSTNYKIQNTQYEIGPSFFFCPEPPLVIPEEGVVVTPEVVYYLTFPGRKKFRLP